MITNYKEYLNLIKEGLIRTYNIYKYELNLYMDFNSVGIKTNIEILDKLKFDIEILNNNELEDAQYNVIIKTCNILGYFPSYLVVYNENNNKNEFHFDKQYLNNKYKKIIIRFEAKYSDGLYSNDIIVPEYLYHLSPTKKIKKILEYGLEPKSNNRKTKYSERIYFFKDKTNYQDLLNNLKLNDKINNLNDNYTLLKVKTNKKTIYHTAPNYINGVYTYDNIHPKNITIELENS